MNKRIKISLDGQSKGVVASVTIEYEDSDKNNEEIINETIEVFKQVDKYAVLKSIEKMR